MARKARFIMPLVALAMLPVLTAVQAPAVDKKEADTFRQLDQFMDVFERVRAEYVEPTDDAKLIEGAINGMLSSLDPHSSFLNARDFENMRTQTDGEYGGLGLSVTMEDGAVKVIAPTDDTPAARAGIKAGDYITHLDGQLIYGGSLDEAVEKMRGKPGTQIKLTVVRAGQKKPLEFLLTRETIQMRPVKFETKGKIGLIRISAFNKQTADATRNAISSLRRQIGPGLLGYVVDLRSNPGGLLDQAIDVSDLFLERGEIVSQRGRGKDNVLRYYARPGDATGGKPVIVLVDEGAASAAEIVAGALQDHRRALVIGKRSFGKGSVQSLIQLSPDTALRLTTARYYTPSGRSVQEAGIDPDIVVPQLSDENYSERTILREADLRYHLRNEALKNDRLSEDDVTSDPRFKETAESLKKRGVTDFQLDYALSILNRLEPPVAPKTLAKR